MRDRDVTQSQQATVAASRTVTDGSTAVLWRPAGAVGRGRTAVGTTGARQPRAAPPLNGPYRSQYAKKTAGVACEAASPHNIVAITVTT
jgi:hypothetical protein